MIRRFRPIVIFLAAFAVVMANAGWISGGSAMAHSAVEKQSHVTAAHGYGTAFSHQDDGSVEVHAVHDCSGGAHSGCEGEHKPGDPYQTCCGAMACHAAIAITSLSVAVIGIHSAVNPLRREFALEQKMLGRLDRPPRSVGA